MRTSGWIFMIISWSFIIGLAIFCFSRVFKQGLDGEGSKIVKRLKK